MKLFPAKIDLWAREQCKKIKTSEGNNFQLYNTSLKDWCLRNLFPRWPVIKCLLLLWSLLVVTQNLNWQPRWLLPRKRDSPKFRARDVGFFSLPVGNGKSWRLRYAFLRQMRFNKAIAQLCPLSTDQNIYSDLVNNCLTEIFRKWTDQLSVQKNHYFNQMPRKGAWRNSSTSLVNQIFLLF